MENRIKIEQTIIVEGRYDKSALASLIDANIITTDGFRIFNDTEKLALIRSLAKRKGVVILTDPDRAGAKIRGFLKGALGEDGVSHVYIPGIAGKERRKTGYSKYGILGVEGVSPEVIIRALERFGITSVDEKEPSGRAVTKTDFYNDGLSGGENSTDMRGRFCTSIGLPYMQANALLGAVNMLLTYDEYRDAVKGLILSDEPVKSGDD